MKKITNNETEITLHASTVKDALHQLIDRYDDDFMMRVFDVNGKPKRFFTILLNGRNVYFIKNLDMELVESDKLTILPSVSGG